MIVLRDTKVNTGRYVYNADNEFLQVDLEVYVV